MSEKNLNEWLEFISETHPSEIEMGLERIRYVYQSLKLSIGNTKIVLVAGTNGKGSTIAMMEACLLASGYKVGVYTSPHILKYNERVRVNGVDVDDISLIQSFEKIEAQRQSIPLTYFEYGTLAAFNILFQQNLDVVLLEIGLGGRLDAVNIVDPHISIITSVDLDHTEWLGDTVEQIGFEKAGILRKNATFLAGENLPFTVYDVANQLGARTLTCRKDFNVCTEQGIKAVELIIHDEKTILSGFPARDLPENNILLSLQAVFILISDDLMTEPFQQNTFAKMVQVINQLSIPGRLEKIEISKDIPIYVDVGHNPHAARYLKTFLEDKATKGFDIQIVYSSLGDKDYQSVLKELAIISSSCVLTQLDTPRATNLNDLVRSAEMTSANNIRSFERNSEAFEYAISFAENSSAKGKPVFTLIFGSFYMVEAAKRFFRDYD